jgi:hypothetical protein
MGDGIISLLLHLLQLLTQLGVLGDRLFQLLLTGF